MDYKVILYNNGDAASVDNAGNFEFYTNDEAELFCQRWAAYGATHRALLWNGAVWRFFS